MVLTKKAKEILKSEELKMLIALEVGTGYSSFRRWITSNHKNLTLAKTIEVLEKHTKLTKEELFEEPTTCKSL
jgi:hypothetical protein